MEHKKIITALAVAVLVGLVGYAVFSRVGSKLSVVNTPGGTTTSTQASAALPLEVATIASSTDLYLIHVEYPRFTEAPLLTQQIDQYVKDSVADFTKTVAENDRARKATAEPGAPAATFQYNLDISWEPAQLNRTFISFIMRQSAFEGGANSRQELRSFNWDFAKQQEVTLSTLFNGDPGYLQNISTYVRQVLKGNLGENTNDQFLADGTKPSLQSFQWFTFTDDAVTVFFPKYQVAPGVAGEQRVMIPRNVDGLF